MTIENWTFDFVNMTATELRIDGTRSWNMMTLNDVMYVSARYNAGGWQYAGFNAMFAKRVFDLYGIWCLEQALDLEFAGET